MVPTSLWSKESNKKPETAKKMAEYIEKRSKYPDQVQINLRFRDILNPKPGEHLLDVGCGSGVLSRLIAPFLEPGGSITGIDNSPGIISFALEQASKDNLVNLIQFKVGDAEDLPCQDNNFDSVFATRLLLHVNDPLRVVEELIRTVKSGGKIALMDWDFETLTVDHPNRKVTRKILHWRTDHKDGNNWSGRQLFSLLNANGLKDINICPLVSIATDENSSLTQSIRHAASGALDQKIITEEEYNAWMLELENRLQLNHFFSSIVYFIAIGISQ